MVSLVSKEQFLDVLSEVGLAESSVIRDALDQVLVSQGSQLADDGSLQIEQHIFPVALEVIRFLMDVKMLEPEIVATALLHDVLEDDRSLDESVFRAKFGSRVYSNVKLLTKQDWESLPGGTDSEKKKLRDKIYYEKLAGAPYEVIIVKLADRLNNISRLDSSPEVGKMERYFQETVDYYLPLAEKHSKYFYRKLVDELKKSNIVNK